MADADDFDVEALRALLRGESPKAAEQPKPTAVKRGAAKKTPSKKAAPKPRAKR